MKRQKEAAQKETLKRILGLIRPYWWMAALILLFAVITVAATLYGPILIGQGVDLIIGQGNVDFAGLRSLILQFLLFGLAADGSNSGLLLSVVLFLGFCIVILFLEASLVRQIQKADPMKRGDIGSLRFNRDWLESCDEAERLGIYKASWKSFQVMNSLCPVIEAVALLGKIMFDTGNFPIILVTILWAVQTGVYCFYSAQYDSRGAGE